jgi:hypothetical protein
VVFFFFQKKKQKVLFRFAEEFGYSTLGEACPAADPEVGVNSTRVVRVLTENLFLGTSKIH